MRYIKGVFLNGMFLLFASIHIDAQVTVSNKIISNEVSLLTITSPKPGMAAPVTSSPWDTDELYKTPMTYATDLAKVNGFKSFFYEGSEYKADKSRVFAYYKKPAGIPPPGGWPAVICVHGGGGTAFPEWVQTWVDHGYAAIAMDPGGTSSYREFSQPRMACKGRSTANHDFRRYRIGR